MNLLYEEQTQLLRGCFFDVQNEVGLGRREEAYHQACKIWLRDRGVPFVSKQPHPLLLDGQEAYVLCPDLVVWDQITIELKAVLRKLGQPEFVQLFDYLKRRKDRLGLLVNFGLDRVHVERLVYDPTEAHWVEDWQYWAGSIQGEDRAAGVAVRNALHAVFAAHGTGYGEEVLSRLVLCALRQSGLEFTVSPISTAQFRGVEVDESGLDCTVVAGRVLLSTTALFDTNQYSVSRGLSYMRSLGLHWGIAADFGKQEVHVSGLRRRAD